MYNGTMTDCRTGGDHLANVPSNTSDKQIVLYGKTSLDLRISSSILNLQSSPLSSIANEPQPFIAIVIPSSDKKMSRNCCLPASVSALRSPCCCCGSRLAIVVDVQWSPDLLSPENGLVPDNDPSTLTRFLGGPSGRPDAGPKPPVSHVLEFRSPCLSEQDLRPSLLLPGKDKNLCLHLQLASHHTLSPGSSHRQLAHLYHHTRPAIFPHRRERLMYFLLYCSEALSLLSETVLAGWSDGTGHMNIPLDGPSERALLSFKTFSHFPDPIL
ncbi:hypothetical protein ACRALDRAFT_208187 [Sodiomyces alcalophilus JCM 7366]|uniref:uncharacterized protein n=1 Tax=Sodiomyces alcalophilus JCM 7366 TaxID=591952 RepID=UPI0039B5280A